MATEYTEFLLESYPGLKLLNFNLHKVEFLKIVCLQEISIGKSTNFHIFYQKIN